MKIIIHGQPITKKNSQQIIIAGKRPCIIPSKAFKAYEKLARAQLAQYPTRYQGPISVKCEYWLGDARRPDLTNLMAATHDILEHCGIIDNDRNIVSVDGSRIVGVDRQNPRVEITIVAVEEIGTQSLMRGERRTYDNY
jgi:Holliday junction resolvase RusA-like endonuclease